MTGLKLLVGALGVAIFACVATIAVVVIRRVGAPRGPIAASLAIPAGARLVELAGVGDRLVLRIADAAGGERLLLVDAHSGRLAGEIELRTDAAPPADRPRP